MHKEKYKLEEPFEKRLMNIVEIGEICLRVSLVCVGGCMRRMLSPASVAECNILLGFCLSVWSISPWSWSYVCFNGRFACAICPGPRDMNLENTMRVDE